MYKIIDALEALCGLDRNNLERIFIITGIFIIAVSVILLIKLFKWIILKKNRVYIFLGVFFMLSGIYLSQLFFVGKMEFIQSEVNPFLYLIKNPIENRAVLNDSIKAIVIKRINQDLKVNFEKYKEKSQFSDSLEYQFYLKFYMTFYQYENGWGINPIGRGGTAYFIKNKESEYGEKVFFKEYLTYYENYQMAVFLPRFYPNDNSNYYGILNFYQNGILTESDTLIDTKQTPVNN